MCVKRGISLLKKEEAAREATQMRPGRPRMSKDIRNTPSAKRRCVRQVATPDETSTSEVQQWSEQWAV
jgi:hypothetical protein